MPDLIVRRGVNNDFLIKSTDPLALRYNDISPMVRSTGSVRLLCPRTMVEGLPNQLCSRDLH